MKRIEYQLRRCIYDDVAYTPKLAGYPTLSDINELCASRRNRKMSSKVINTKLGEVEYCSIGKGIPVLFVHGGHSNCNETLWHKGFDLEKFQLISPSRPGYGRTPLDKNKTPRQSADIIVELLNYLSVDNVIVYGISAGGLTAIELASNYPERVDKLILGSAVTKEWHEKTGKIYKLSKRIFHPNIEFITWSMVRFFSILLPKYIAKTFISELSSASFNKLPSEEITEFIDLLKRFRSQKGFVNDIDQNVNVETLRLITCPTLIIHSKYDNSVLIEHAEHAKTEIKNSKINILDNIWGHMIWIGKDYKIVEELILDFINESAST